MYTAQESAFPVSDTLYRQPVNASILCFPQMNMSIYYYEIITCHIFKWCGKLSAESTEICFMWAVVYGVGAGTIDLNIMLDKFRGKSE